MAALCEEGSANASEVGPCLVSRPAIVAWSYCGMLLICAHCNKIEVRSHALTQSSGQPASCRRRVAPGSSTVMTAKCIESTDVTICFLAYDDRHRTTIWYVHPEKCIQWWWYKFVEMSSTMLPERSMFFGNPFSRKFIRKEGKRPVV